MSRDQSCDQSSTLDRGLKWQLRCQTRQTNYCRVKLGKSDSPNFVLSMASASVLSFSAGYALSELRLYKELKVAMDSHVSELQASVENLECRYHQCLERLKEAESLGFTRNS